MQLTSKVGCPVCFARLTIDLEALQFHSTQSNPHKPKLHLCQKQSLHEDGNDEGDETEAGNENKVSDTHVMTQPFLPGKPNFLHAASIVGM